LESYRFIQESEKELGIEAEPIIHPIILKDLFRLERRNLVKAVRSDITKTATALVDIFDALKPYYLHMTKQFRP
jgi:hypothetical protein